MRVAAVVLLALALSACSGKHRHAAEVATHEFRERCARAAYDDIYADTAPELWTVTTKDEFMKTMRILTQLGAWKSSDPTRAQVKRGIWTATTVSLSFLSKYDKGFAAEEYVWVIKDDRAKLAAYRFKGARAN